MEPGYLAISRHCIMDAKMGELIIIYDKGVDVSQSDARFKFRIDDPCVQKWENYPNINDNSYYGGTRIHDTNAKILDFICDTICELIFSMLKFIFGSLLIFFFHFR